MSKQPDDGGSPQSSMKTYPSVGRFSNDHKVSLHTKGSSAKFNGNDKSKSMTAPGSNPGQPSSQQRSATDIVDLRTAPGSEWKAMKPAKVIFNNNLCSVKGSGWMKVLQGEGDIFFLKRLAF